MNNLPPGVTPSMIPGNSPEDEYFESFVDELDFSLGDNIVMPPKGLAQVFNNLHQAFQDIWSNGFSHGRGEGQMEQLEKMADLYERVEAADYNAHTSERALGEALDKVEEIHKALQKAESFDKAEETLSWIEEELLNEILEKFHGDYIPDREDP